jgi:hypothetical protein
VYCKMKMTIKKDHRTADDDGGDGPRPRDFLETRLTRRGTRTTTCVAPDAGYMHHNSIS